MVSSNKVARSAIVVYALVLHLVAFVVLAGFSHRHVDKLDALEELCSQLGAEGSGAGAGGGAADAASVGVDPVMGSGIATVVGETVGALRRTLLHALN